MGHTSSCRNTSNFGLPCRSLPSPSPATPLFFYLSANSHPPSFHHNQASIPCGELQFRLNLHILSNSPSFLYTLSRPPPLLEPLLPPPCNRRPNPRPAALFNPAAGCFKHCGLPRAIQSPAFSCRSGTEPPPPCPPPAAKALNFHHIFPPSTVPLPPILESASDP